MTPRPDVRTLERRWTARILAEIADAGFNRFPVVEQTGAMPVGLFHTKDLLDNRSEQPLVAPLRPLCSSCPRARTSPRCWPRCAREAGIWPPSWTSMATSPAW
jgi:hypothetical protein